MPTSGSQRALRESVEKSVALLQRTGVGFLREGGCFSCNSQNMTGMVVRAARNPGAQVDEAIDLEMSKGVVALRGVGEQPMLQMVDPSGAPDTMMYTLFQMSAARVPPGRFSDAAVHYLAATRHKDGRWINTGEPRPPIQDGNFYITAMGLRSLQLYGIPARKTEFDRAIQRAAMWLRNARPRSTTDRVFQLLGLQWSAGAAPADRLHELLAMQQPDRRLVADSLSLQRRLRHRASSLCPARTQRFATQHKDSRSSTLASPGRRFKTAISISLRWAFAACSSMAFQRGKPSLIEPLNAPRCG